MRVVGLINGSLISETASVYAMRYAKMLGAKFDLVHVRGKDSFNDVKNSVEDLNALASSLNIESEFLTFENFNGFLKYTEEKDIDMIFCSTRQDHSIFDRSFVQTLIRAHIKADLAVVKVVKLSRESSIDKIVLPIRGSKLSVKKFSFFTTFALAYNSKAEIYSIDKLSRSKMALNDAQKEKNRLKEVVFNLRHYMRIGKMMDFKFSIKHDYALAEGEKVKTHIAKHSYDLAIVGGHHDRSFFGQHPIDILFQQPMLNTIFFIPYKDEL